MCVYHKYHNVKKIFLGVMNKKQQVALAMNTQTYRYLKERKIDYQNTMYAIPKLMHTPGQLLLSRIKCQVPKSSSILYQHINGDPCIRTTNCFCTLYPHFNEMF